jgi:branched-chain amino acid transport system ATP-binding protein
LTLLSPAETILSARGLTLGFGGIRALDDVSFDVTRGEIFSVIGPNGAGKTSLLNCISGRYRPSAGKIVFEGTLLSSRSIKDRAALGIGRTFQNLALFSHMTVLDNILVGRHHLLECGFLRGMVYWALGARREEIRHRREVEAIIDFLEIEPYRKALAGTLSYGVRKRVELARAIALRPRLLLLDEPMAGMNLEEKEDMARFIIDLNEEWGMTVIMIEHDMGVVMDVSHRIMVLDFGRKIAEGGSREIAADGRVKAAYLGSAETASLSPEI